MDTLCPHQSAGWGDDDLIPLALLNQFVYCPRRAGLMAVDGVFTHNAYTLEGTFQHDRAHESGEGAVDGLRVARALPLFNRRLGLVGKADVVEFHPSPAGEVPYPVEYKHGPRHQWDNDDVQLCAQALCLEEMLGMPVPVGAVFHVASKRRREVPLDAQLRQTTLDAADGVRRLLADKTTPPAVLGPRCEGCSLRPACMPEVLADSQRVQALLRELFHCKPETKE
jgi:CRISPR-associated exonuclease Cas4